MRYTLTHRHFTFGIFALCCLLTTLFLGFWQVERLDEKRTYLKNIHRAMQKPPLPIALLTAQMMGGESDKLQYRPVHFDGVFLPEKVVTISPRVHKGVVGHYTLVPLQLKTGETILVNMGWSAVVPTLTFPKQEVRIDGFLRLSEASTSFFSADNTPEKGQWHRIDVRALSHHLSLPMNLPFYVNAKNGPRLIQDTSVSHTPSDAETAPAAIKGPGIQGLGIQGPETKTVAQKETLIPVVQFPDVPNNHFTYAITWFSLSLCIILLYLFYIRQSFLGRRTQSA